MSRHGNERFDAEAAAWDSNPDVHVASAGALTALRAAYPQLADDTPHRLDVLEIGCGTGLLTLRLAPHVRSIWAVDASPGMIDALSAKLQRPDAPGNVKPLCMMLEDAEDPRLPPHDESRPQGPRKKFDLVISHLTLHHIPEAAFQPLLRTMLACLQPGTGTVALTDFEDNGPQARRFHPEAKMSGVQRHGIQQAWMVEQLQQAGFANVHVGAVWSMDKEVERFPGEWDQGKPSGPLAKAEFPFLLMQGQSA